MVQTIKALCDSKGITIKELERICGMSNGSISKWDKNAPTVGRAMYVADVLDVPVTYLLKGDFPELHKALGEVGGINNRFFELNEDQKFLVNAMIEQLLKTQQIG